MGGPHSSSLTDAIKGNAAILVMWGWCVVMVFLRPGTWGIWIGVIMLLGVGAMAVAWHGAASAPQRFDRGWWPFFRWAAVPGGTALCCISLKWLYPRQATLPPTSQPPSEENPSQPPS